MQQLVPTQGFRDYTQETRNLLTGKSRLYPGNPNILFDVLYLKES